MIIIKSGSNNPVVSAPLVTDSEFSWMDVARQTVSDSFTWQNAAIIGAGVGATVLTGGGALLPILATEIAASTAITGLFNAGLEYLDPTLVGVNSVQTETDKIRSVGGKASTTVHEVSQPVSEVVKAGRVVLKIGKGVL